ncbi:MAG: DUF4345 family protein [Lysobacterales bacterium]
MQPKQVPDWARFVLVVAGLAMLGFGVLLALDPINWLAGAGVTVGADAVTRIEIGAFYGGIEVGIGLLLLMAAAQRQYQRAGLWLLLATHGGIGLTRAALVLASGTSTPFLLAAGGYELLFAALAMAALMARPRLHNRL